MVRETATTALRSRRALPLCHVRYRDRAAFVGGALVLRHCGRDLIFRGAPFPLLRFALARGEATEREETRVSSLTRDIDFSLLF